MTKRMVLTVMVLAGLGFCFVLAVISSANSGLPRSGDTVRPRIIRPLQWHPGTQGELWVDLSATNQAGATRQLSFLASPRVNPVAMIQFYGVRGEGLGYHRVEISQRC